jgi:hypothetical protein
MILPLAEPLRKHTKMASFFKRLMATYRYRFPIDPQLVAN